MQLFCTVRLINRKKSIRAQIKILLRTVFVKKRMTMIFPV